MEKELVRIVSDNPAHTKGYYTQFRDKMKPGDVEYSGNEPASVPETPKYIKKKVKR